MPRRNDLKKILLIGSGPIIVGQACEFDYSGSQACKALKEEGYEVVLINSNPATIMTDPQMADRTYIEPITPEVVEKIIARERPDAILPTLGGQTDLNVAVFLARDGVYDRYGVEVIGASAEAISRAEDRKRFKELVDKLELKQAPCATATSVEEVRALAQEIGYPVLLRPSYVLGGRAMEIVYDDADVERFMKKAIEASLERPVLVDKFLEEAIEIDVDCVSDGETAVIGGIMEHIEEAGIHSGDSACILQ